MPFWIFIGMTLSPFIDGYFCVTSSDLTVCWIPIISESYGTQVQGLLSWVLRPTTAARRDTERCCTLLFIQYAGDYYALWARYSGDWQCVTIGIPQSSYVFRAHPTGVPLVGGAVRNSDTHA